MTVVIGTAGHIDHGKTALLRALTGIDADRLPEERARGMTIDVGYAHLDLDDGTTLDFVDVPGHDRLVGNMLVGAGEIDGALFVVAADDGPRAQTREHLELLDALAINLGLAVVTKVDAVDPGRVEEVVAAVRELLAGTSLAGSPVVAASANTGTGLDVVRGGLVDLRDRALAARPDGAGPARLAIDRAFRVRGRGLVVTGTLRAGSVERGAILRVVPGPAGAAVRIRELQVHNRPAESAGPGRTALNVAPVGDEVALERGTVLTADPAVVATDRLGVAIRYPLADRTPVVVHLGTVRVAGIVSASGRSTVDLGGGATSAVLRLERPVAAAPGDRFVLRRPSPPETLAGGRVVDPDPPRGAARRRSTPERVRALAAAASEAWAAARLELHGFLPGGRALAADLGEELDALLVSSVAERGPTASGELVRLGAAVLRRRVGALDGLERAVEERLERLLSAGRLARLGGLIVPPGTDRDRVTPEVAAAMDRLVALLSVAAPPSLVEAAAGARCPADGVRRLERDGRIVRVDEDLAWSAETYAELVARVLELARTGPLTPAALRDATGTSRKIVMALLEDLGRRAILTRTPAGHVPGPRAASAPPVAGARP